MVKRICAFCGEEIKEIENVAYSDNGVDQDPYICEFCYLNLEKVKTK